MLAVNRKLALYFGEPLIGRPCCLARRLVPQQQLFPLAGRGQRLDGAFWAREESVRNGGGAFMTGASGLGAVEGRNAGEKVRHCDYVDKIIMKNVLTATK